MVHHATSPHVEMTHRNSCGVAVQVAAAGSARARRVPPSHHPATDPCRWDPATCGYTAVGEPCERQWRGGDGGITQGCSAIAPILLCCAVWPTSEAAAANHQSGTPPDNTEWGLFKAPLRCPLLPCTPFNETIKPPGGSITCIRKGHLVLEGHTPPPTPLALALLLVVVVVCGGSLSSCSASSPTGPGPAAADRWTYSPSAALRGKQTARAAAISVPRAGVWCGVDAVVISCCRAHSACHTPQ